MVLYNARPIFGVFPSFQPASARGKDGSAHKSTMTEKGYLIHNSTMLQFDILTHFKRWKWNLETFCGDDRRGHLIVPVKAQDVQLLCLELPSFSFWATLEYCRVHAGRESGKPRTGKATLVPVLAFHVAFNWKDAPEGLSRLLFAGLPVVFKKKKKKAVRTDCFWQERSWIKCTGKVEPQHCDVKQRVPNKTETFWAYVNKHNHSKLSVHFAAGRQAVGRGGGRGTSYLNPFNSSQVQKMRARKEVEGFSR